MCPQACGAVKGSPALPAWSCSSRLAPLHHLLRPGSRPRRCVSGHDLTNNDVLVSVEAAWLFLTLIKTRLFLTLIDHVYTLQPALGGDRSVDWLPHFDSFARYHCCLVQDGSYPVRVQLQAPGRPLPCDYKDLSPSTLVRRPAEHEINRKANTREELAAMILPRIAVTPSGRPQLLPSEIERLLLDKVDLEFEGVGGTEGCQTADRYQNGYVVVTSHRLIWIDTAAAPNPGRSCCLPLDSIHSTHKRVQYGINLINPKVRLEVKVYVDLKSQPCNMLTSATFRYLQLRCRGEGPDAFHEQLTAAIQALQQQQDQQQRRKQQQAAQQQQQQQQQQQTAALPWGSGSVYGSRVSAPSGYSAGIGPALDNTGAGRLSSPADHSQGITPWQRGPAAAAAAAGQRLEVQQAQAVDKDLLASLLDMGFPRTRVLRALLATHSEHLQAALDWILAAGQDPSMDAALPGPEPVQVSRQELQQLQQLASMQQRMQQLPPSAAGHPPVPGWGMGSVSSAAAAAAGGSSSSWAGAWPPAGPSVAAAAVAAGGGSSSILYSSASGPAGYGQLAAAMPPPPLLLQQQQQQQGPGSRVIGVAGIMQREADKTSQTAANLAVAFQDLDNLMGMAAEMVKLAEKFRGVMGPDGKITLNPGGGSSGCSDAAAAAAAGDLLLDADTQLQLIAMGIASPVTKASAGARYYQELSRQLADFLAAPLAKAGGVLMLSDVYCLFNRARGSELVSPDDLVQACEAFQQVGLPLRLRKFPSGVIVVQGSQFSDTQLCRNIDQLLQQLIEQQKQEATAVAACAPPLGPPLAATDVSAALLLPLTLAKEALLVAEARGVLCRDDGPEGLRFFRNFFKEAQPVAV